MKIAAISDIHGNLAALEVVLDDARRRDVDAIVNLGDICSGPLFPCETADLLMPLGLPTICGNHERQLLDSDIASMGLSDQHARARLNDGHLAWLASLPDTLSLFDDRVRLVHGTPESDLTYFLETVDRDGVRPANAGEVEARATGSEASLILCGHTHVARAHRLGDGRLVMNPGSVGLQAYSDDAPWLHVIENSSPQARYAVATCRSDEWKVEFIALNYDWAGAASVAEANGRPDWSHALRTGRVGRSATAPASVSAFDYNGDVDATS